MDEELQRKQIQAKVNEYFGKKINIRPRAMAALQGRYVVDGEAWNRESVITGLSVFEELLSVSPMVLHSLFDAGIAIEKLTTSQKSFQIGDFLADTLEWIFQGVYDDDIHYEMCSAGEEVEDSGKLDETDLFKAFLQTAYQGPVEFTEKADKYSLTHYTTEVGYSLLDACNIDLETFEESWDGKRGTYRATSKAAEHFLNISESLNSIRTIDPSHDLFQYALWLDSKGKLRVRPFGVGSLGNLTPSYIKSGSGFVFREGIFHPAGFNSSIPGYDTISIFESMINSNSCSEQEFQCFFKKNPEFLLGLDYKQVHPQLVLYNDESDDLIPDFMLEPMSSSFCDLIELKLPYVELVRRLRQGSRIRFRAFINEAIAQLVQYRRYFDSISNRKLFHERYGLDAFYPKMVLVVGRRHHFRDDAERQELTSLLPKDLSIWTYDDLLIRAKTYKRITTKF